MRTLMKAQLPADPTNNLAASARVETMRALLEALKPEAAYFYPERGIRTTIVVFDLKSPSDLPSISEPIFRQGGTVEFAPVMNLEDLQAGVKKIDVSVGA
jgi:hypothetical protein